MADFPLSTIPNQGDDELALLAKIAASSAQAAGGSVIADFATMYPVETVAATSGQTVPFYDDYRNTTLWLVPVTDLASLTVTLPSDANSWLGQVVSIGTERAITSLTITGATIFNTITTLSAGDLFALRKVGANKWARYQV